ncbi:MAG TPA: hypothetical protein GXX40_00760 [Firmicutes bacterium]|nr:hypothetical protein [Bacillota bacterium]
MREVLETGSTSMVARRHSVRDNVAGHWCGSS